MKRLGFILLMLISIATVSAQNPKREMRAAWLATVWGIDWPNSKITSTGNESEINSQKRGMIRMLDSLKRANLNTVFFQVRSRSDVMFKSKYEPWSSDLVATRGMNPGYDPLQFVIDECHKRGMELHAWLNPYRFETTADQWKDQAGDYRKTNPDWVMSYSNGNSILNPGIPAVAERIRDIVMEIVNGYDVDGITFDDYFYAYGGTPSTLDQAAQNLYKPAGKDVNDWRRENVNAMIAIVYNAIQQSKPWVTFGVSPFGIWTTDSKVAEKEGIPLPQGITGGNMYAEIYCDPVAWLKEGTVDYISPQLYWPTGQTGQDYNILAPWWSDLAAKFGKHFYSSQSLSSLENSSLLVKSARINGVEVQINDGISLREKSALIEKTNLIQPRLLPSEYIAQINRNRIADKNDAPGSVFYSANGFYKKGFIPNLLNSVFASNALPPAIHWKQANQYNPVSNLKVENNTLSWSPVNGIVRYAVYAIERNKINDPKSYLSSENLLGISYQTFFSIPQKYDQSTFTYAVTPLDRFGNEAAATVLDAPIFTNKPAGLLYPSNGDGVTHATTFGWEEVPGVTSYFLELSDSPVFDNLMYCFETTGNTFSANKINALKNGNTYYWRVRTRVIGNNDMYSEVRSVRSVSLEITYPLNNAKDISVTPTIVWNGIGKDYVYTLQVATSSTFTQLLAEYTNISATTFTIPKETLLAEKVYYIRVKGEYSGNASAWTPVVAFTTEALIPEIPVVINPTHQQQISDTELLVEWQEEPKAKSFRVELCDTPDFPVRKIKVKSSPAYTYNVKFTDLTPGIYYLRARADYGLTYTAWSPTIQVELIATSLDKTSSKGLKVYSLKDRKSIVVLSDKDLMSSEMSVYSITGQEVYRKNITMDAGMPKVIEMPQTIGKGAFIVVVKSQSGRNSFKIIL